MRALDVVDMVVPDEGPGVNRTDIDGTCIDQGTRNSPPECRRHAYLILFDYSGGSESVRLRVMDTHTDSRIGEILNIVLRNPIILCQAMDDRGIGHHQAVVKKAIAFNADILSALPDFNAGEIVILKKTAFHQQMVRFLGTNDRRTNSGEVASNNLHASGSQPVNTNQRFPLLVPQERGAFDG